MTDKPKLTPFSSRVKEISRNLKMVSAQVEVTMATINRLKDFVTDVVILADELGPEQQELMEIAEEVGEFLSGLDDVHNKLDDAHVSADACARRLADRLEDYMGREVTNPYEPMFSPEKHEETFRDVASSVALRKFDELYGQE